MTTPANRPPPDFYRVARDGIDGVREYADGNCGWTREMSRAALYKDKYTAERERDRYATKTRIVPVRVKATKVPRQHDFGWALRRMREGKRVRRASWGPIACRQMFDGALASEAKYPTTVTSEDAFATDWQLYEPEVGS